jgi:hypothetical protein
MNKLKLVENKDYGLKKIVTDRPTIIVFTNYNAMSDHSLLNYLIAVQNSRVRDNHPDCSMSSSRPRGNYPAEGSPCFPLSRQTHES